MKIKKTKTKKKSFITFPLEGLNSSGGIRIISEIANLLATRGFPVRIILPEYASKKHFYLANEIDIKLVSLKKKNSLNKLLYFIFLSTLSARSSNTLVATTFKSVVVIWISKFFCFNFSSKIIHIIQGLDNVSLIQNTNFNYLKKRVNLILYFLSNKIHKSGIAVSSYVFKNNPNCQIVINNFVNTSTFFPINKISPINKVLKIGTVSSTVPNKGFEFFLSSCNKLRTYLKDRNIDLEVFCATQDDDLITKSYSGVKIIQPNSDSEMNAFYNKCDIFFLTSYSEGFSLPVLEAMACGCLVISTNCGGILDFLKNGLNGFIIEERNEQLLISIISNLLDDTNKFIQIRTSAIQTSNEFNKEKFESTYLSFFRKT